MKFSEHNSKTVIFDEKYHIYKCDNIRLTPVTTFLKQFQKPFDPDGSIAARCAAKAGITTAEIQNQWAMKGKAAAERGSYIHAYMESLFNGTDIVLPDFQDKSALIMQADKLWGRLKNWYQPVESEKIIFSPAFGLAGTVDLIMLNRKNNELVVMDFKTNSVFKMGNQYENLLPPFHAFSASHLNIYSLQLAVYREILEKENYYPDISGIKTGLIWINPDRTEFIKPAEFDGLTENILKTGLNHNS